MAKKKKTARVKITPAKGRPMLSWVGKRPLRVVPAFPAQHVETYDPIGDLQADKPTDIWKDWPDAYPKGGLLFHGDNKEVLAHLLANGFRGKVDLIYIDPPFDSGADYVRRVELRGIKGTAKIDGEGYTLGEQIQYTDIWANDNYLQFMYERILLLRELLAEQATVWLHCDYHKSHYLKCLCDEVFSPIGFVEEVVWKRSAPRGNVIKGLSVAHDSILVYSKGSDPTWHPPFLKYSQEYKARFTQADPDGRLYTTDNLISPNPDRPNLDYVWKGVRKVWRVTKEKMRELERKGRLVHTSGGVARYKRYLDELEGQPLTTLWDDIPPINSQAAERVNYPTQKPERLIERMVVTASDPGDTVLDCFIGCGTTAAVAQKLGRYWIACDINRGAIQTTAKRLQNIIAEQAERTRQGRLKGIQSGNNVAPGTVQYAFTVWRVNDYNLNIQHIEAVNIACEYIGIEQTRSDVFFDGTLGKKLVKIIPFNHPLTPLDLEELKKELDARPDEDRDITLVCLGMELAAQAWIEDWNRHRKVGALNRIDVIELCTDPKYAGFIKHDPATAKISIKRAKGKIKVEIKNFISPTIVKRLDMEHSLFKAKVTDWRSMVDCVMIDTAYNGDIFNVALSDVPEKKNSLVAGTYELPAPDGKTNVAVKIIDMLGEEVLVTKEV